MATSRSHSAAHNARVKLAFQLGVHAPIWTLVALGMSALGNSGAAHAGPSEHFARMVALAVAEFGLIAAALGLAAPFLDQSEDGDDLRRERRALLLGACALVASGSSLLLLTIAGPGRIVSSAAGLTGWLVLGVIATVALAMRWQRLDELNRGVARESGYLAFTCVSWAGGLWATLAHLDMVAGPAPLDWLTMLQGFSFVAGLVAFARRGGFNPVTDSRPSGSRIAN